MVDANKPVIDIINNTLYARPGFVYKRRSNKNRFKGKLRKNKV